MKVGVYDSYFQPASIPVSAGTRVVWTNYGKHTHTVTSDDFLWDSDELRSGGTYGYTFSQPGTYPYHCAVHPQKMRAVIVVK